jgi:hypothetical protein
MFAVWLRRRRQPALTERVGSGAPAEQSFPVAVVAAHGVFAVVTVLLVLLVALGVGGS